MQVQLEAEHTDFSPLCNRILAAGQQMEKVIGSFLISSKMYLVLSWIHFPSQGVFFQPQKLLHVFVFLYLKIGSGRGITEGSLLEAATHVEIASAKKKKGHDQLIRTHFNNNYNTGEKTFSLPLQPATKMMQFGNYIFQMQTYANHISKPHFF